MLVSVIVPVYNRKELIKECIDSLLNQTLEDYEIIIVDDGSTDGTREIIDRIHNPKITLIKNKKNMGIPASRNKGASQGRGEIIAFTDSDCIMKENWLEELVNPFRQDSRVMIVSGQTIDAKPETYWEFVNYGRDAVGVKEGYVSKAFACDMAIKRSFLITNPFDERIHGAEDLEISFRCLKKGFKIYYNPLAQVLHRRRITFASTLRQQFNYGSANTYIGFKNKIFPYWNYGTWLLLGIFLAFVMKIFIASLCFGGIYAILTLTLNQSAGRKNFFITLGVYPGFLLSCLANNLGNFYGFYLFLKHLKDK